MFGRISWAGLYIGIRVWITKFKVERCNVSVRTRFVNANRVKVQSTWKNDTPSFLEIVADVARVDERPDEVAEGAVLELRALDRVRVDARERAVEVGGARGARVVLEVEQRVALRVGGDVGAQVLRTQFRGRIH